MARTRTRESDLPLFAGETKTFLTISELNEIIKETLESRLDAFWVVGEISNLRVPPSGHCYFTLKDDKSQIAAVMFRRQGAALRFTPENGMEVLCFGRVSLYSVRGDLQLYVETMEPRGQGALYLAFEQLKEKLVPRTAPTGDETIDNDVQLKRALDLLKSWDVFKQLVQKKAA